MTMNKAHWSVAAAKAELSHVIEQSSVAPQIIEERGQPVAVVVSFADYQLAVGADGTLRGFEVAGLSREEPRTARAGWCGHLAFCS
jgi:prevent-host-death family protein